MAKRVCIIGAGPSGIAAGKNAREAGFDFDVFEKGDRVGGNWVFNAKTGHSSVYENTHIISSKTWSQYEDFPMPADYPDYPHHSQLQAYFEGYARHFGVYERIRFGRTVTRATRDAATGLWTVAFAGEDGAPQRSVYDALMVANGHHWNPKFPDYPGTFAGRYLHSHDFKGVDEAWRGKNVLVIGAGNSACDVAVEAARVAGKVTISQRSPQWFVPKFIFGMPSDVFAARTPDWVPRPVKQFTLTKLLNVLQGSYEQYGLPVNTKPALSHHPTLNSDFLDFIRHGRIKPRPAVRSFDGNDVEFVDGRREAYDIVCACTGFSTVFPFFDRDFVDFEHAQKLPLYRKMLHPDYPNLYFIGLFQPIGCIWPLADLQAKLACLELLGKYRRPANLPAAIRREIAHPHFDFGPGVRHAAEVDYMTFRRELAADLKSAGVDVGIAPPKRKSEPRSARVPGRRRAAGHR